MELSHLHHIEFLGSKEDSGSNLETEPLPGPEKKGILGGFNDQPMKRNIVLDIGFDVPGPCGGQHLPSIVYEALVRFP